MSEPSADRVREVLDFDPTTGIFVWRAGRLTGVKAGTRSQGYTKIVVDGRSCLAHRLAWLHVHGCAAPGQIDHRNGNRSDNRLENLRAGSAHLNQQNRRRANRNNSAAMLGVERRPGGGFRARIYADGRHLHLGCFATADLAHAAYLAAKRRLHPGATL